MIHNVRINDELSFYNLVDYDIELEFENDKVKVLRLLDNNNLHNFVK